MNTIPYTTKSGEIVNVVGIRREPARIRWIWVFFIAAAMQIIPFTIINPESLVEIKKALLISSYLLLCWGLISNRHLWSFRLILFGVLLNFTAIVFNGGLMPVSPEAISLAGLPELGSTWLGKVAPHGTGSILLAVDQTRLWAFTDIIPVKLIRMVVSVGDVALGVGLFVFSVEIGWRRWKQGM